MYYYFVYIYIYELIHFHESHKFSLDELAEAVPTPRLPAKLPKFVRTAPAAPVVDEAAQFFYPLNAYSAFEADPATLPAALGAAAEDENDPDYDQTFPYPAAYPKANDSPYEFYQLLSASANTLLPVTVQAYPLSF